MIVVLVALVMSTLSLRLCLAKRLSGSPCHVAFGSVRETCPLLTCTDNICVPKTQDFKDQAFIRLLQAASALFKNICCSIEESVCVAVGTNCQ